MVAEIDLMIEELLKHQPRGFRTLIAKFADMKAKLAGLYQAPTHEKPKQVPDDQTITIVEEARPQADLPSA
jgi:hypothetical protein